MTEIFAQGDLLIERVSDVVPSGTIAENSEGALMVLLEVARSAHEAGGLVFKQAQSSGELALAEAVQISMRKLRERAECVVKTLALE